MKLSPIIGLIVSGALIVMGIILGSPLSIFYDQGAFCIAVLGTAFTLLATHGKDTILLHEGLRRWWFEADSPWGAEQCRKAAQVANSGGTLAIMMGGIGCLIGLVAMLQNMGDPSQIGPAMAVALLTVFYVTLMNLLFFVPMSRHFTEAAIDAEAEGVTTG